MARSKRKTCCMTLYSPEFLRQNRMHLFTTFQAELKLLPTFRANFGGIKTTEQSFPLKVNVLFVLFFNSACWITDLEKLCLKINHFKPTESPVIGGHQISEQTSATPESPGPMDPVEMLLGCFPRWGPFFFLFFLDLHLQAMIAF